MTAQAPDPKVREGAAVAGMFSAIAPTYDLLNHLLSFNVDRSWRRAAVKAVQASPRMTCLDLCTGTGDLAFELLKRVPVEAVGADFSAAMLERAQRKAAYRRLPLRLVRADALRLPFADASFDRLLVAFGIRNFESLEAGFSEMARVLKPGGRAVILEFSMPDRSLFGALYRIYFGKVLPVLGRLISGRKGAYQYLAATVEGFPAPHELARRLALAGLRLREQRPLTAGIATLHVTERAPDAGRSSAPKS
jgi:demethylmenaquinone methyltransferase/2-methoxy-6-polyprenyl-1,4-benzoquinol methylase